MKVVADTMMWVSYATRGDGFRHRLIEQAVKRRVRIFVSEYILNELCETLVDDLDCTPRFARRARRAILRIARRVILPGRIGEFVVDDPDDNPIVQTALTAKAHYLVTADHVLLRLGKVRNVEIITAAEFKRQIDSII